MNCCHGSNDNKDKGSSRMRWLVIAIFAIGGGYYLWTQHQAHVLQYWPLAIFLLCPFMHFSGGHGKHGSAHQHHGGGDKSEVKSDA